MSAHPDSVGDISDTALSYELSLESSSNSTGVDSGYSSALVTPNEKVIGRGSIRGPNPRFFPPKETDDLKRFEKGIDKATEDRYEDIRERLEVALAKHMVKSRRKYSPMAIRMMVLGTTEEDARAWIVVFCSKHRAKRVQRFFDEPMTKDLYQPRDPDIPSFQFKIYEQPPQTRAGSTIEVYSQANASTGTHTLCGTLIKLSEGDQTRIGTLGGIVKVTSDDGHFAFYGITAGHLTEGMGHSGHDGINELYDSDDDGNDWTSSDESDLQSKKDQLLDGFAIKRQLEIESMNNWRPIGSVLTASSITNRTAMKVANPWNRDWAIIELEPQQDLKPNMLRAAEGVQKYHFEDLKVRSQDGLKITAPLHVVMASGLQGIKHGTLSPLPCSVLLSPGTRFVHAYALKLRDGAEISQGDSGSWVIDGITREVYGHVVASDRFGDAYVIPIHEILGDMKSQLEAASVELLSSVDIAFARVREPPPSNPIIPPVNLRPPVTPPLLAQSCLPAPENNTESGDSGYSSLDGTPNMLSHVDTSLTKPGQRKRIPKPPTQFPMPTPHTAGDEIFLPLLSSDKPDR